MLGLSYLCLLPVLNFLLPYGKADEDILASGSGDYNTVQDILLTNHMKKENVETEGSPLDDEGLKDVNTQRTGFSEAISLSEESWDLSTLQNYNVKDSTINNNIEINDISDVSEETLNTNENISSDQSDDKSYTYFHGTDYDDNKKSDDNHKRKNTYVEIDGNDYSINGKSDYSHDEEKSSANNHKTDNLNDDAWNKALKEFCKSKGMILGPTKRCVKVSKITVTDSEDSLGKSNDNNSGRLKSILSEHKDSNEMKTDYETFREIYGIKSDEYYGEKQSSEDYEDDQVEEKLDLPDISNSKSNNNDESGQLEKDFDGGGNSRTENFKKFESNRPEDFGDYKQGLENETEINSIQNSHEIFVYESSHEKYSNEVDEEGISACKEYLELRNSPCPRENIKVTIKEETPDRFQRICSCERTRLKCKTDDDCKESGGICDKDNYCLGVQVPNIHEVPTSCNKKMKAGCMDQNFLATFDDTTCICTPTVCSFFQRCPEGYICDPDTRYCTRSGAETVCPAHLVSECDSLKETGLSFVFTPNCQCEEVECTDQIECPENEECKNGVCKETGPSNHCRRNSDCSIYETCISGWCIPPRICPKRTYRVNSTCTPGCREDKDCFDHEVCEITKYKPKGDCKVEPRRSCPLDLHYLPYDAPKGQCRPTCSKHAHCYSGPNLKRQMCFYGRCVDVVQRCDSEENRNLGAVCCGPYACIDLTNFLGSRISPEQAAELAVQYRWLIRCRDDVDCPQTDICDVKRSKTWGICIAKITCRIGFQENHFPGGTVCENGQLVRKYCQTHEGCPHRSLDVECSLNTREFVCYPSVVVPCHPDCVCDVLRLFCIRDRTPAQYCTSASQCPQGQRCDDGGNCVVVHDPRNCTVEDLSQCRYGQICLQSTCKDEQYECRNNRDCSRPEICAFGICQGPTNCDSCKFSCIEGVCIKLCPDPKITDLKLCKRPKVKCEDDSHCYPPYKCRSDRYGGKRCTIDVCHVTEDCPTNWECKTGACVPRLICFSDRDCRQGQVCEDYVCKSRKPCICDCDCSFPYDSCQHGSCRISCNSHHNCRQHDLVCDFDRRLCVKPECREFSDCPEQNRCQNFACVPNIACKDVEHCTRVSADRWLTGNKVHSKYECVKFVCQRPCPCELGFNCKDNTCVPDHEDGCQTDRDCDMPYKCRHGKCTFISCSAGQCPPGQYCDEGRCVLYPACGIDDFCPYDLACNGYGRCGPKDPSECKSYKECDYGEACVRGKCERRKCAPHCFKCFEGICYDNCHGKQCPERHCKRQCPKDQYCYMGECLAIRCRQSSDCPGHLKCDRRLAICHDPECHAQQDCKPGFMCVGSKCELAQLCSLDADCGKGKVCHYNGVRKVCVEEGILKPCNYKGDCSANEVCQCHTYRNCYCGQATLATECSSDADCRADKQCRENTCVPFRHCYDSSNCPQGYQCDQQANLCRAETTLCPFWEVKDPKRNLCLVSCKVDPTVCDHLKYKATCGIVQGKDQYKTEVCVPADCKDAKDCQQGFYCHQTMGACYRETATCTDCCQLDLDCQHEQICVYGRCHDICGECPKGFECRNSICHPKKCKGYVKNDVCITPSDCWRHSNCGHGLKCVNNRCVPTEQPGYCHSTSECFKLQYCDENQCVCTLNHCFQTCSAEHSCPTGYKCQRVRGQDICVEHPISGPGCPYPGMTRVHNTCVFPECSNYRDCRGNHLCFLGRCVAVPSRCDAVKCPPNQDCVHGLCLPGNIVCRLDQDCRHHEDRFCDRGICTPRIVGSCPAGMYLEEHNHCIIALCRTSSDCQGDLDCLRPPSEQFGICIENPEVGPGERQCSFSQFSTGEHCENVQCFHNGHCGPSEFCLFGFCRDRRAECTSDRHGIGCGTEEICSSSKICVKTCDHCPSGIYTCSVDLCVVRISCGQDGDCPRDMRCDESHHRCVVNPRRIPVVCGPSSPCPEGFKCYDRLCFKECQNGNCQSGGFTCVSDYDICVEELTCSKDGYCPLVGQFCESGRCRFADCRMDGDCPIREFCVQGKCESDECLKSDCFSCQKRQCDRQQCTGTVCLTNLRCSTRTDCAQDQACQLTDKQRNLKTCVPIACKHEKDCPNLLCRSIDSSKQKFCITGLGGFTENCENDKHCPKGRVCLFGQCHTSCEHCKDKCVNVGRVRVCLDDRECDGAEVRCPDGRECDAAVVRCPPGLSCREGRCRPLQCYHHVDCPGRQICMFGSCVHLTPREECQNSGQCPQDYACITGKCLKLEECADDNDCPSYQRCDILFKKKNGKLGLCVPEIKCNPNGYQPNGCPAGMECDRKAVCISVECRPKTCHPDQLCQALAIQYVKKICFPVFGCRSHRNCGLQEKCDRRDGRCKRTCQHCTKAEQCVRGVCVGRQRCKRSSDCPSGQICSDEECVLEPRECNNHHDCHLGCFGGLCPRQCENGHCQAGGECHEVLKICVTRCQEGCQENYYCDRHTDSCLPVLRCRTDQECPVDTVCMTGDRECRGESTCHCRPKTNCQRCSRGFCLQKKYCPVSPAKCDTCSEASICPVINGKKSDICRLKCNIYDRYSCPADEACVQDDHGVFSCIPQRRCIRNTECEPPLSCVNQQCQQPECYRSQDCGWGEYCYNGLCDRPKPPPVQCQSDADCQAGTCIKIAGRPGGVCQRCDPDCPADKCRHGYCDATVRTCRKDHHCDEYHQCKDGICVTRECDNCSTGTCVAGTCVPQTCFFHDDCAEGMVCERNHCIPTCKVKDCYPGQRCESGICVWEPELCEQCAHLCIQVGQGYKCRRPQCLRDSDCPEDEVCIDGLCKSLVEQCKDASDCPPSRPLCKDGNCFRSNRCRAHIDCIRGWYCDLKAGVCRRKDECGKPRSPRCGYGYCFLYRCTPHCSIDAECPAGYECFGGKCSRSCHTVMDCRRGHYCHQRKCHPACHEQGDCLAEHVCLRGECVPSQSCDCRDNEECLNGLCHRTCKDRKCPKNMMCFNGFCYWKIVCTTDQDCPSHQVCDKDKGDCVPDQGCGKLTCKLDDPDCVDSCYPEVCMNGECQPPPSPPCPDYGYVVDAHGRCIRDCKTVKCPKEFWCNQPTGLCEREYRCLKSEDCGTGKLCLNKKCVSLECMTSQTCLRKYADKPVCVDGMCVAGSPSCTLDQDCGSEGVCDLGVCAVKQCQTGQIILQGECVGPYTCTHPSRCPDTMTCSYNTCERVKCPKTPCPPMTTCIHGRCTAVQCERNIDCPQSVCNKLYKVCVSKCLSDADCSRGYTCRENQCQISNGCSSYADCTYGKMCADDKGCQPLVCYAGSDCPPDRPLCVHGECVNRGEKCRYGFCPSAPECSSDSDCRQNQFCSKKWKSCVPYIRCYANECPYDMFCKNQICIPTACTKDSDCPEGRTCDQHKCIIANQCNCNDNEICLNGKCRRKCKGTNCKCGHNGVCSEENCDKTKCSAALYCDRELHTCNLPQCYSREDCGQHKVCILGTCLKDSAGKCQSCKSDEICRWSRCLPREFAKCGKIAKCLHGFVCDQDLQLCYPEIICTKDTDCAYPTQCDHGLCKLHPIDRCIESTETVEPELCLPKLRCKISSDCKLNEICLNDDCRRYCNSDQDCIDRDHICGDNHVCTPRRQCDECKEGEICIQDQCHSVQCLHHDDCPRTFPVCLAGKCGTCNYHGCEGSCSECKLWEVCRNGICMPKMLGCSKKCPPGMRCQQGRCVPDKPIPNACKQCQYGQVCVRGKCHQLCSNNKDCVTGSCIYGVCVLDSGCPCHPGEVCHDNKCVSAECFTNHDCDTLGTCLYGKCLYRHPSCYSELDCPNYHQCLQGTCVQNSCKCRSYEKCQLNQCYRPWKCFEDHHCPNGMECDQYSGECKINSCNTDSDCKSSKLMCMESMHICIPKSGCSEDKDCPSGMMCNRLIRACQNVCYNNYGIGPCVECKRICPSNYRCKNDQCLEIFDCNKHPCKAPQICKLLGKQYVCVYPDCFGDADCPAQKYCVDGMCQIPCTSKCPEGYTCHFGICKPSAECPCTENYYCGSDRICRPKRPCNPAYHECGYGEVCQCRDGPCNCEELSCSDDPSLCRFPEVCHADLGRCVTSQICYKDTDCADGQCCDVLHRCTQCCSTDEDCGLKQKCEWGKCVTVVVIDPGVYCYKQYCSKIRCLMNEDCNGDICFYGECIPKPEKCTKACKMCINNEICVQLFPPWIPLTNGNSTDQELECNELICIPKIRCYDSSHCPTNTKCEGNFCRIKRCTELSFCNSQECTENVVSIMDECREGVCKKQTCLPYFKCQVTEDCSKGQACINGDCLDSCTQDGNNKCKQGEICHFFWTDFGVCIPNIKCDEYSSCDRKQYCHKEKEICIPITPSCPIGYNEIAGVCHQNFRCTQGIFKCPSYHICDRDLHMCLRVEKCYPNHCNPGYYCVHGRCEPNIVCKHSLDCPRNMKCSRRKCVFEPCKGKCKGLRNQCLYKNGLSLCLPRPICFNRMMCLENEKCIGLRCVEVCNGKCKVGETCEKNQCVPTETACKNGCGLHHKCLKDNYNEVCVPIQCLHDGDCPMSRSTCWYGECVPGFKLCQTEYDCPSGKYCQDHGKYGGLCIPNPKCSTGCPIGSICSHSSQLCIPIIECTINEDCPDDMSCSLYDSLQHAICTEKSCKQNKECKSNNCLDGICAPKPLRFFCQTKRDCMKIGSEYDCVLGECSRSNCNLQGKGINEYSCFPICQTDSDCKKDFYCYHGSCIEGKDQCQCKPHQECFKGKCFDTGSCRDIDDCPSPYLCQRGKCTMPTCVSEECECVRKGFCKANKCHESAISCPYSSMRCDNNVCKYPLCSRDYECNGLFCINGVCQNVKQCHQSYKDCLCLENTCLGEPDCQNCPVGYECHKSTICIPVGVNCFSNEHCPEHMICKDQTCRVNDCHNDHDCSYGRVCKKTNYVSLCVPNIESPCSIGKLDGCIPCKHSYNCPVPGMLCYHGKCIPPLPCSSCHPEEFCFQGICMKKCKDQCKEDEYCSNGKCLKISREVCESDEVQHPKYGCQPKIYCYFDEHCSKPLWCDNHERICVNYCNKDKACAKDYVCKHKKCIIPPAGPKPCVHSNECTPGTYCDNVLNKCIYHCMSDRDCKEKEKCIKGSCEEEKTCKNCPQLYFCENRRCTKVDCIKHVCGRGYFCKYGSCVREHICQTDFDCKSNEKCIGDQPKVCTKFNSCKKCSDHQICVKERDVCIPKIFCQSQCPAGMACAKGFCVPSCGGKVCKLAEYCINDNCIPLTHINPKCKKHDNCPSQHLCEKGKCVRKQCIDDKDCLGYDDRCVMYTCMPTRCYSNIDCPAYPYNTCDNGQCASSCNRLSEKLINGKCEKLKCKDSQECPQPFICKQHVCSKCVNDNDCSIGQTCKKINDKLNACLSLETVCFSHENCAKGQICWNQKCVPACQADRSSCPRHLDCVKVYKNTHGCIPSCRDRCTAISEQCSEAGCKIPYCSRDRDCPGRSYCSAGYCISINECQQDKDCPGRSQHCLHGVCMNEIICSKDVNCPLGFNCIQMSRTKICLPYHVACYEDHHCPELMMCDNGRCVPNVCIKDFHCPSHYPKLRECKNGVCLPFVKCEGENCQRCKTDEDCSNNQECVQHTCQVKRRECYPPDVVIDGKCVRPECQTDFECHSQYICVQGKCVYPRTKCSKKCKPIEECVLGVCVTINCNYPFRFNTVTGKCDLYCKHDQDCLDHQKCIKKKCVDIVCYTSEDCSRNHLCVHGRCEVECSYDNNCKFGQVCLERRCVSTCGSQNECKVGQWCQNQCVSLQCYLNSDCLYPDEVCHYGWCIPVRRCAKDFDCPTDYYCVGEKGKKACVKQKPHCSESNCVKKNELCEGNRQDGFTMCLSKVRCHANQHCPINMYCSRYEGQCRAWQCSQSTCAQGFVCHKDLCIPESGCHSQGCAVTCKLAEDCPLGKFCFAHQCVDYDCHHSGECPLGLICFYGTCVEKIPNPCANCQHLCYQGLCVQIGCESNKDCPSPSFCNNQRICQQPECGDCGPDQECVGNMCVEKICQTDKDGFCVCNVDKDCSRLEKCRQGKCIQACRSGYECQLAVPCRYHVCTPQNCHSDSDCAYDKFCSDGTCIHVVPCNKFELEKLHGKHCIRERAILDIKCNNNADCPHGYSCLLDVCMPRHVRCQFNTDCSEFMKCGPGHHCMPNACRRDIDCSSRRVCVDQLCVPKLPCNNHGDCKQGYVCHNPYCEQVCTKYSCGIATVCNQKTGRCEVIPSTECDYFRKCPAGKICLSNSPDGKRGKCVDANCNQLYGCRSGQICSSGFCTSCKECKNNPYFKCRQGVCVPINLIISCKYECPWPFKCRQGRCVDYCDSDLDCQYEHPNHKFECSKHVCVPKSCRDICEKPSHTCSPGSCRRVACLKDKDCPVQNVCFLGYCIGLEKKQCTKNEFLEPNLLVCLPKGYPTKPKIYCRLNSDCPVSMKCDNHVCKINHCSSPLGQERMVHTIQCGQNRLCIKTQYGNQCIPGHPCFHEECNHPLLPQRKMFKCHVTSGLCYVSKDQCTKDFDCRKDEICVYNLREHTRICVRNVCKKDSDCPKGKFCLNETCRECSQCKFNADCPINMICLRAGCCVDSPRCSDSNPWVCNHLLGLTDLTSNYCHFHRCVYCRRHPDCSNNYACHPTGHFCYNDCKITQPCKSWYRCATDKNGVSVCRLRPRCRTSVHCPPNQLCEVNHQRCVERCTTDLDCEQRTGRKGSYCIQGLCTTSEIVKLRCRTHADCQDPAAQGYNPHKPFCFGKACGSYLSCGENCPSTHTCVLLGKRKYCLETCLETSDCRSFRGQSMACVLLDSSKGGKVRACVATNRCVTDADCARGQTCVAGLCELSDDECTILNDWDDQGTCPEEDQVCKVHHAKKKKCEARRCLPPDNYCPNGQVCYQGACRKDRGACQTHTGCKPDEWCIRFTCIRVECSVFTNSICVNLGRCVKGFCVSDCSPRCKHHQVCDAKSRRCKAKRDYLKPQPPENMCALCYERYENCVHNRCARRPTGEMCEKSCAGDEICVDSKFSPTRICRNSTICGYECDFETEDCGHRGCIRKRPQCLRTCPPGYECDVTLGTCVMKRGACAQIRCYRGDWSGDVCMEYEPTQFLYPGKLKVAECRPQESCRFFNGCPHAQCNRFPVILQKPGSLKPKLFTVDRCFNANTCGSNVGSCRWSTGQPTADGVCLCVTEKRCPLCRKHRARKNLNFHCEAVPDTDMKKCVPSATPITKPSQPCRPACVTGEVCIAGKCFRLECDRYGNCPDGFQCKNYVCERHSCTGSEDCPDRYLCHEVEKVCVKHHVQACHLPLSCAYGGAGYCINKLCMSTPPIIRCTRDDDCPVPLPRCADRLQRCTSKHPFTSKWLHQYVECVFNSQCNEGQVCVNSWCRSGLGYPVCARDRDCRHEHEVCRQSLCQPKSVDVGCLFDKDCGTNEFCYKSQCHLEVPVGCYKSEDCPRDAPVCINAVCWRRPKESCKENSDCGPTYGYVVCQNQECRQIGPTTVTPPWLQCHSNVQCDRQQWCVNGQCTKHRPQGACSTDDECDKGQLCWKGRCQSIVFPAEGCVTDQDCPAGHPVCYRHVCYTTRKTWCYSNADCPSAHPVCYEGRCESGLKLACDSVQDCPVGQVCTGNSCVNPIPRRQCSRHADCPDHQPFCFREECVLEVLEWCINDEDCRYTRFPKVQVKCVNNWCDKMFLSPGVVPVTADHVREGCRSDGDCLNRYGNITHNQCIHGACYNYDMLHVYCRVSSDCPRGPYTCSKANVCILNKYKKKCTVTDAAKQDCEADAMEFCQPHLGHCVSNDEKVSCDVKPYYGKKLSVYILSCRRSYGPRKVCNDHVCWMVQMPRVGCEGDGDCPRGFMCTYRNNRRGCVVRYPEGTKHEYSLTLAYGTSVYQKDPDHGTIFSRFEDIYKNDNEATKDNRSLSLVLGENSGSSDGVQTFSRFGKRKREAERWNEPMKKEDNGLSLKRFFSWFMK